ncbi:hypothetical protein K1X84_10545 [bacterium]|nr:hypothetical protein [bacterium]
MRVLILLLISVFSELSAQDADYQALILSCNGSVTSIGQKDKTVLKAGMLLRNGDSLAFSGQSIVQVLDFTGKKQTYLQSTRINFSSQSKNDLLASKLIRQMASIREWSKTAAEKMTVRSGNTTETFLESPRNSKLTELPDRLTWIENSTKKFDIAIRCYDNDFTFDETITGNTFALSEKIGIQKDIIYHWYVKPHYETIAQVPVAVWFSVMDESEKRLWESEKRHLESIADSATVEYKLLYAQLLLQHEMNQDAKTILDRMLDQEPYNSSAQLLMAVACERLEMIPEAQRALKLSQK